MSPLNARFGLLLGLAACAPPEVDALFTTLSLDAVDDGAAASDTLATVADEAVDELRIAVPALEDDDLTDAILAAHERGVDVQVVTDVDRSLDAGVLALQAAEVPLTLADGEVAYHDYAIDSEVYWPSGSVTMAHSFAVADQTNVALATRAGDSADGTRAVMRLSSQDIGQDLLAEFGQVFGGTDASSLTAFNSLAKSITDTRWIYPTQTDLDAQVWFGPQERLVKRITDAVYSARASVWVLSGDLADEGLTRALQDKASNDFDVRVVVGGRFGRNAPAISDTFATQSPDVLKSIVLDADVVPTIVLVDYALDRNGDRAMAQAFVLSHDLVSASRLYYSTTIPTDQLIDGTLVVLQDYDEPSEALLTLLEVVQDHRDRAEAL